MSSIKKIVITAMLIAVGIALPVVFHMIPVGMGGRVILPMHIPVFLAGLIVGPFYGFFAGLVTPLLSSMTTGMPAAGIAVYRMMVELSAYGAVAGVVMHFLRTKRLVLDLYISLIAAMFLGRIAAGIAAAALLFGTGTFTWAIWITGYFATSLPGIALQLIIIPAIVITLERGGFIPKRYNKVTKRSVADG